MINETDRHSFALTRAGKFAPAGDAELLTLIDELREREKRRDEILDRLSIEEGDQIEGAAKKGLRCR
jgi:hypothetical protein